MKLEKYSLIDKSKILFHQNLINNNIRSTPLLSITVVPSLNNSTFPPLHQNWACKKSKSNVKFNDKQKQFLQEKFDEGVTTGMKWDPIRVASDMEMLICNGNYVFLTPSQIKSFFSRLALKQRSTQQALSQQILTNTASSTSLSMSTADTNNTKSNEIIVVDEPDDNENIEDRDGYVYSWRQVFDEARGILDHASLTANTSLKRKPKTDK